MRKNGSKRIGFWFIGFLCLYICLGIALSNASSGEVQKCCPVQKDCKPVQKYEACQKPTQKPTQKCEACQKSPKKHRQLFRRLKERRNK